jgi:hypothetical protein
MTAFKAMLNALNLSHAEAAELLGNKKATIEDISRGKTRAPAGMLVELGGWFERVEAAADMIIANQAVVGDDPGSVLPVMVAAIPLPTRALREAAAARAMLVLGPHFLAIADEPRGQR